MSKFKVGDKVVFNKEKAKRDIDSLLPGADNWLDDVPKGPLTIKEAVGIATVLVEESPFRFSLDWLDKYEESECGGCFKVGDKVKVLKDRICPQDHPDFWTIFVNGGKVYTVGEVLDDGRTIKLADDRFGFLYAPHWLEKVEAEEQRCEVKVSEGRIKDVKFSDPATIVFWTDGTKTVVKCRKGDKFDPEKGIAMACAKKLLGNEDGYHKDIEKYLTKNKTTSGGIESMKTEEIRSAVRAGCRLFPSLTDDCASRCPCRYGNGGDGTCCFIAHGSRDQLIKMLKSFEKAGYFSYEDWRMHHA